MIKNEDRALKTAEYLLQIKAIKLKLYACLQISEVDRDSLGSEENAREIACENGHDGADLYDRRSGRGGWLPCCAPRHRGQIQHPSKIGVRQPGLRSRIHDAEGNSLHLIARRGRAQRDKLGTRSGGYVRSGMDSTHRGRRGVERHHISRRDGFPCEDGSGSASPSAGDVDRDDASNIGSGHPGAREVEDGRGPDGHTLVLRDHPTDAVASRRAAHGVTAGVHPTSDPSPGSVTTHGNVHPCATDMYCHTGGHSR